MRPEEQTRRRHSRRPAKRPLASQRRLIFLSSMTHRAGRLDFSNLQLEKGYSGSLPACCNISQCKERTPVFHIFYIDLQTIGACLQASRGMQIQSLPLCWLQRSGRRRFRERESTQCDIAVAVHPGLVDTELARGWLTGADVSGELSASLSFTASRMPLSQ